MAVNGFFKVRNDNGHHIKRYEEQKKRETIRRQKEEKEIEKEIERMRKQLDRQRVEIEKNKITNRKEIIRQVHLGQDQQFYVEIY